MTEDMLTFVLQMLWVVIKYGLIICTVLIPLSYFVSPRKKFDNISETWYCTFANQHFPIKEFYALVQEEVAQKKIKDIKLDIVEYSDGIFTARDYLQVVRYNQMLLICAAPFGTDYFISVRQGQPIDIIEDLAMRLPLIGRLLMRRLFRRNFYRLDTDAMYHATIKRCVEAAIERATVARAERLNLQPAADNGESKKIEYA